MLDDYAAGTHCRRWRGAGGIGNRPSSTILGNLMRVGIVETSDTLGRGEVYLSHLSKALAGFGVQVELLGRIPQ